MSYFLHHYKLWAQLSTVFAVGLALGFLGRNCEIPIERLGGQSFRLAKIGQEAMLFRATPQRVADRVEKELNTKVKWEVKLDDSDSPPQRVGVVVLPAETGFGSMGGRWILHMSVAKDGRCERVWMEMQPVGFM